MGIMIQIREIDADDPVLLEQAFTAQGWHKPAVQFKRYLHEHQSGKRVVLLAEYAGEFAGYLTIMWLSDYPPFREAGVPEVVDFNVLIKFQRRGVGTRLMDEAERRIGARSGVAGIGFGLMHDYGAAQALYVRRGYVPDGRGVFAHGRWLNDGDQTTIDHDVALYLTKQLNAPS